MSKPKNVNDILSNIQTLTAEIQKLETQESQRLQLIQSNNDIETNKQQYITINSNKWKCIKHILSFKRRIINKNVLDTMKASSPTIKAAVQYVKNVDTPSMREYNLTNPTFNTQRLDSTITDLKSCSNNVQKDGIMFVKALQNEWSNDIKIRSNNIAISNNEEKQFQVAITKLINDQLGSFTKSYNNLEKQRISLLNAKCNVLIFMTISHSDILYKLMLANGQYSQHDILNEMHKMDSIIMEIKECMKNVVSISNELGNEITICNNSGDKQKAKEIERILVDIGGKLSNLHRALLTIEDIKMDNEISKYLNDKINIIQKKIQTLGNDTKSLTMTAKNYIKVQQKNNAKNMLGRRKLCVLQQDEYKRKLKILQNAVQQINYNNGDVAENNEIEIKIEENDDINDDVSEVSSVNTDDLDKVVDKNAVNVENVELSDKILDTDYTNWDVNDILLWIIRLKPNDFIQYKDILNEKLSEKNIKGGQFGMLTKNDLQSFGVNKNDAMYISKQIEQLVSCYNEDLLDEMYDDDELTGEIL